jgi:hypothetical protein
MQNAVLHPPALQHSQIHLLVAEDHKLCEQVETAEFTPSHVYLIFGIEENCCCFS